MCHHEVAISFERLLVAARFNPDRDRLYLISGSLSFVKTARNHYIKQIVFAHVETNHAYK